MPGMDIFNSNAFGLIELTGALNKRDFQPSYLRQKGLFTPRRVRTEGVWIEEKDGVLNVIPTSPRGAPLDQRTTQVRTGRAFSTPRIAKGDRINASEIAGIRQFGTESEFEQVQDVISDRLNGPSGLMREVELTWENMMLGGVQGIVYDADGTTVIYNWFTEFNVTQATEIDFDLDNGSPASGAVRKVCNQVVRQMQVAAKGAWVPGGTSVEAICGDAFWDDLTGHIEVRSTYLNTQQAQDLRNDVGTPYESFRYGNITWTNYRGTDDGTTVAVGTDLAKFFPVGSPAAFQAAYSPGEFFDTVNQPGQEVYALIVPDKDRDAYADVEVYSYPLFIPTRPGMLQRAKRT